MKIAVIGSGIAGLSAAWLLSRRHEVTLFESQARTGGHSNTVLTADGQAVDTGFIVYNEHNYPNLTRLFAHLGVATRASDMSFGVTVDGGAYEYAGDSLATLFLQPSNLVSTSHWRMLTDILRFNALTKKLLREDRLPDLSLGAVLAQRGFGKALATRYLLPMAGAIWSCSMRQAAEFPYPEFARFFDSHGLLNAVQRPQWRTVVGGSRAYVERLLADFRGTLRTATPVRALRRSGGGVELATAAGTEHFDSVVSAAHSDQTLRLLSDADAAERDILGAIPFADNRAYLHTDISLLPRRRAAWSSWNYLGSSDAGNDAPVAVSYWMNRLQGLAGPTQYIVSLNPPRPPAADKTLYETVYAHPQFCGAAMAAQRRLHEIQGLNRLWFCGAWSGYGFHEDGLASALAAAAALGCPAPWPVKRPAQHGAGFWNSGPAILPGAV